MLMLKRLKFALMRMRALTAQLAAVTITPMNDTIVTAATMTMATIRTVAVIGRKGLKLVSIAATDQTTSSPPLMNLTQM